MAAINLQLARARYQGRLTEDWIMVDIPNWLKHVDDHVVFPSYDLTVNGSKWIKFSSYGHFVGALESYWKQKNPVELQHPKLRVVVMSYTPVAEAHQLHQLLSNPDLLPSSYTEVIGTPSVVSLGPMQMQGGEEDEEEEEEDILNEERDGILYLAALGVNVQFTITNYSVLWAKSERFCMNTFMSEAFEDVLSRLVLCEQHLHQPTAATLVNLRANLMHAKRHLIFAMYLNDSNPHDAILQLFPDVHDTVYLDCVHCNPNIDDEDALDPPDTMLRLYAELVAIGLHHYDFELTIELAQLNLVCAEGLVEGYSSEFRGMRSFNAAKDNLKQSILPLLNELHVMSHQPSVVGVPPTIIGNDGL